MPVLSNPFPRGDGGSSGGPPASQLLPAMGATRRFSNGRNVVVSWLQPHAAVPLDGIGRNVVCWLQPHAAAPRSEGKSHFEMLAAPYQWEGRGKSGAERPSDENVIKGKRRDGTSWTEFAVRFLSQLGAARSEGWTEMGFCLHRGCRLRSPRVACPAGDLPLLDFGCQVWRVSGGVSCVPGNVALLTGI